MRPFKQVMAIGLLCLGGVTDSYAEDGSGITLELNKIEPVDNDCVLTFVVSSNLKADVSKLAYEFVVFDAEFRVQRMTVFDFRDIAAGKYRVRQFQLPNTNCGSLGRLLINDVSACKGDAVDPSQCVAGLKITNKTNTEFLN